MQLIERINFFAVCFILCARLAPVCALFQLLSRVKRLRLELRRPIDISDSIFNFYHHIIENEAKSNKYIQISHLQYFYLLIGQI
jgi:hypothetical protein